MVEEASGSFGPGLWPRLARNIVLFSLKLYIKLTGIWETSSIKLMTYSWPTINTNSIQKLEFLKYLLNIFMFLELR
jgi:hypothetical protein